MASTTNPLKADPELKKLLKKSKKLKSTDEFDEWKKSFLQRVDEIVANDSESIERASDSYTRVTAEVDYFGHKVLRLQQVIKNGLLTSTKKTVRGQKALNEIKENAQEAKLTLIEWMPGVTRDEEKLGYSKWQLGAVLVRNGFEIYETMELCRDILMRAKTECLDEIADHQTLDAIDHYARQIDRFCSVMRDLGLLDIMMTTHNLNAKTDWAKKKRRTLSGNLEHILMPSKKEAPKSNPSAPVAAVENSDSDRDDFSNMGDDETSVYSATENGNSASPEVREVPKEITSFRQNHTTPGGSTADETFSDGSTSYTTDSDGSGHCSIAGPSLCDTQSTLKAKKDSKVKEPSRVVQEGKPAPASVGRKRDNQQEGRKGGKRDDKSGHSEGSKAKKSCKKKDVDEKSATTKPEKGSRTREDKKAGSCAKDVDDKSTASSKPKKQRRTREDEKDFDDKSIASSKPKKDRRSRDLDGKSNHSKPKEDRQSREDKKSADDDLDDQTKVSKAKRDRHSLEDKKSAGDDLDDKSKVSKVKRDRRSLEDKKSAGDDLDDKSKVSKVKRDRGSREDKKSAGDDLDVKCTVLKPKKDRRSRKDEKGVDGAKDFDGKSNHSSEAKSTGGRSSKPKTAPDPRLSRSSVKPAAVGDLKPISCRPSGRNAEPAIDICGSLGGGDPKPIPYRLLASAVKPSADICGSQGTPLRPIPYKRPGTTDETGPLTKIVPEDDNAASQSETRGRKGKPRADEKASVPSAKPKEKRSESKSKKQRKDKDGVVPDLDDASVVSPKREAESKNKKKQPKSQSKFLDTLKAWTLPLKSKTKKSEDKQRKSLSGATEPDEASVVSTKSKDKPKKEKRRSEPRLSSPAESDTSVKSKAKPKKEKRRKSVGKICENDADIPNHSPSNPDDQILDERPCDEAAASVKSKSKRRESRSEADDEDNLDDKSKSKRKKGKSRKTRQNDDDTSPPSSEEPTKEQKGKGDPGRDEEASLTPIPETSVETANVPPACEAELQTAEEKSKSVEDDSSPAVADNNPRSAAEDDEPEQGDVKAKRKKEKRKKVSCTPEPRSVDHAADPDRCIPPAKDRVDDNDQGGDPAELESASPDPSIDHESSLPEPESTISSASNERHSPPNPDCTKTDLSISDEPAIEDSEQKSDEENGNVQSKPACDDPMNGGDDGTPAAEAGPTSQPSELDADFDNSSESECGIPGDELEPYEPYNFEDEPSTNDEPSMWDILTKNIDRRDAEPACIGDNCDSDGSQEPELFAEPPRDELPPKTEVSGLLTDENEDNGPPEPFHSTTNSKFAAEPEFAEPEPKLEPVVPLVDKNCEAGHPEPVVAEHPNKMSNSDVSHSEGKVDEPPRDIIECNHGDDAPAEECAEFRSDENECNDGDGPQEEYLGLFEEDIDEPARFENICVVDVDVDDSPPEDTLDPAKEDIDEPPKFKNTCNDDDDGPTEKISDEPAEEDIVEPLNTVCNDDDDDDGPPEEIPDEPSEEDIVEPPNTVCNDDDDDDGPPEEIPDEPSEEDIVEPPNTVCNDDDDDDDDGPPEEIPDEPSEEDIVDPPKFETVCDDDDDDDDGPPEEIFDESSEEDIDCPLKFDTVCDDANDDNDGPPEEIPDKPSEEDIDDPPKFSTVCNDDVSPAEDNPDEPSEENIVEHTKVCSDSDDPTVEVDNAPSNDIDYRGDGSPAEDHDLPLKFENICHADGPPEEDLNDSRSNDIDCDDKSPPEENLDKPQKSENVCNADGPPEEDLSNSPSNDIDCDDDSPPKVDLDEPQKSENVCNAGGPPEEDPSNSPSNDIDCVNDSQPQKSENVCNGDGPPEEDLNDSPSNDIDCDDDSPSEEDLDKPPKSNKVDSHCKDIHKSDDESSCTSAALEEELAKPKIIPDEGEPDSSNTEENDEVAKEASIESKPEETCNDDGGGDGPSRPKLRVQFGHPMLKKYNRTLRHDDCVMVPSMIGKEDDLVNYYRLVEEITKLQQKGVENANWALSKDGNHLVCENGAESKTVKLITKRICKYFNIKQDSVLVRIEMYRDGGDTKTPEHDIIAYKPRNPSEKKHNISVHVSLGAERELVLTNKSGGEETAIYFPLRNNGVFSVGRDVNVRFENGINEADAPCENGRVCLRLCGRAKGIVDEEGSPDLLDR